MVCLNYAGWAFNKGKLNICCQFGFQRCISVFPHDQQSKGESSAVYTDPCCEDWLTTDRQIHFWSPDSRPQRKQHWRESLNRLELSRQVGSSASHCCKKRGRRKVGRAMYRNVSLSKISIAEQGGRLEIQLSFHLHMPSPTNAAAAT